MLQSSDKTFLWLLGDATIQGGGFGCASQQALVSHQIQTVLMNWLNAAGAALSILKDRLILCRLSEHFKLYKAQGGGGGKKNPDSVIDKKRKEKGK